ncbi:MAG TPA: ABC transporter permease [Dehalococcoidales bacterium]
MNARLIMTLIKKDLTLFTRNQFYFIITIVGLVMYILMYFVMPKTMDETLKLGIYAPGMPAVENSLVSDHGIEAKTFGTIEELREAVMRNEYPAAIALPEDLLSKLATGQKPVVTIYFSSSAPEEMKGAIKALVNQLAYLVTEQQTPLEMRSEVLGPDLLGMQIPWRDRLIPMLAIMILGLEIMSLASLISTEVEQNTVKALLVTPLKLRHLFTAKAILGIGLSFIQVLLFIIVVGGLSHEPLTMMLVLLLGSILVTGLGFLIASLAHDMMGVTSWGMIATITFFIPAIGGMIPGILSGWAKVLPSYHLTDAISRLSNYGATINDIGSHLLIILGWSIAFAVIGITALRRRYT